MREITIYPAARVENSIIVVDGVGRFYTWSEALEAKRHAGRKVWVDICGAIVCQSCTECGRMTADANSSICLSCIDANEPNRAMEYSNL